MKNNQIEPDGETGESEKREDHEGIAGFEVKGRGARKGSITSAPRKMRRPSPIACPQKRGMLPFSGKARYSTLIDWPGDARRMDRSPAYTAPALSRAGKDL
jgi:hypothetical protein